MKFLISIIMVLLFMNLFAQAKDEAAPVDASGTAIKLDPSQTNVKVEPGSKYETTQVGGETVRKSNGGPQGKLEECDQTKANGGCNPSPNHKGALVTNNKGELLKTVQGGGTPTKIDQGVGNAEKK